MSLTLWYAVGDSGTILKSSNLGTSWVAESIPEPYRSTNYNSVSFAADTGRVVGENGSILSTRNAGGLWIPETSRVFSNLRGEFVPPLYSTQFNAGVSWIVGDSGTILSTYNGGLTWSPQSSGTSENLSNVLFTDNLTGLAVGENGTILRTTTGGTTAPRFLGLPAVVDFGPVSLGTTRSGTIIVRNTGPTPLTISSVSIDNERFTISPTSATIQSDAQLVFDVIFAPTHRGTELGTATFADDGVASPHFISLAGIAEDARLRSSWVRQNPLPQGNFLHAVQFVDENTALAVGSFGTIIKSTDGGVDWTTLTSGAETLDDLTAISIINQNTATAVGTHGTINRTTDGGTTWINQESRTTDFLSSVSYSDANHGIAVGQDLSSGYVSIHQTSDGGSSWSHRYLDRISGLTSVSMVNAYVSFAAGAEILQSPPFGYGGVIFKTLDGGIHWEKQSMGNSKLYDLHFFNERVGVVAGDGGAILRTSDGGATWNTQHAGTINPYGISFPFSISFSDTLNGMAVGMLGTVLHTTDGGLSWLDQSFNTTNILSAISLASSSAGIMLSFDSYGNSPFSIVYRTSNGGVNWVEETRGATSEGLLAVSFVDQKTGTAAGKGGTVLYTSDGGTHWTRQLQGTLFEKLGLSFHGISDLHVGGGAIVGDQGIILHTTDGGQLWSIQTSPTTNQLNAVSFLDDSEGYAVGNNGTILRTADAGNIWVDESGLTSSNFNGVAMIEPEHPIIVGDLGKIFTSSDGGGTWINRPSGTTYDLYAVSYHTDTAYAAGAFGTIVRSIDGGNTWTAQMSGTRSHLRGIQFSNSSVGAIVGDDGTILRTTDGGSTWISQSSGTTVPLYALSFSDVNSGTVVGEFGTILHTSTGGVLAVREGSSLQIPREFVLEQNYPNPFNPTTLIRYQLPAVAERSGTSLYNVMLKIYDLLGQEVVSLVDGKQEPGTYSVSWYTRNVPSGVYFYQLRAGNFSSVKKMLLVR